MAPGVPFTVAEAVTPERPEHELDGHPAVVARETPVILTLLSVSDTENVKFKEALLALALFELLDATLSNDPGVKFKNSRLNVPRCTLHSTETSLQSPEPLEPSV
jgi:hypothetical protein